MTSLVTAELGTKPYSCHLCSYKCKQKGHLKEHKQLKHNIDVVWHSCDLCSFKCKKKSTLKQHKQYKHNIDVVWHSCDLCSYKCKERTTLRQHKQNKHNIDVVWHSCDLCSFKCKHKGNLKTHKQTKHNIDVVWYSCDLCSFQCKTKGELKRHKQYVENIGDKTCQLCEKTNLGVVKPYGSNGKYIDMCDDCAIETGQKKRIEHRYTQYLDKHIDFPSINDRVVRGSVCLKYRPDKIYVGINRIVHIEIDEHQHQNKSGDYTCDEKRISDIYDEFQAPVPEHYIVIRLNTDSYQTENKYYQVDRDKIFNKRAKILIRLMKKIEKQPPPSKICIYYLYYSNDNNRIAKNIPHMLLNDENIEKFLKES